MPTLFLILGWGYQPERVQAGIYLLFYTLLASLPLLVVNIRVIVVKLPIALSCCRRYTNKEGGYLIHIPTP